jgi:cardiolipin synthase
VFSGPKFSFHFFDAIRLSLHYTKTGDLMLKINLCFYLMIFGVIDFGLGSQTFAQTQTIDPPANTVVPTAKNINQVLDPHGADCAPKTTNPKNANIKKTTAASPAFVPLVDSQLQILGTPNVNQENAAPLNNCHQGFISAIQNAKVSIRMTMFHLTDQAVVQALVAAARKRLDVQVILDPSSPNVAQIIQTLKSAGIMVAQSSPCFNMTHEKSFVFDGSTAAIQKHLTPTSILGAMNMTGENQTSNSPHDLTDVCETTRDFDVVTHDAMVANDIGHLFSEDYQSALANPPIAKGMCPSAPLQSKSLVLSPTNSEAKLVALIASSYDPKTTAKIKNKTIQCTAENWGDQAIQKALLTAAENGVSVQIIAPECDQNIDPSFDFDKAATLPMLIGQKNITVKAMPAPPSNSHPYLHSKMCRINDSVTYVGSINFSTQSTHANRELGIIFKSSAKSSPGRQIDQAFNADFAAANAVPNPVPKNFGNCPSAN